MLISASFVPAALLIKSYGASSAASSNQIRASINAVGKKGLREEGREAVEKDDAAKEY